MLILAADTSGKHGSIALVECASASTGPKAVNREDRQEKTSSPQSVTRRTLGLMPLEGGTFSAQLVPQIAELLSANGLDKNSIDAFAVVSGPGSFTGLRVGLAAIKALAEILQKPIAAVSVLEAIAFELSFDQSHRHARQNFLIALDAGRKEAYVGEYQSGERFPLCASESLLTFDELASRAGNIRLPIQTPDETLDQYFSESGDVRVSRIQRPDAAAFAGIGYEKLIAGKTVSPLELDANYIRRADAEIKRPIHTPA